MRGGGGGGRRRGKSGVSEMEGEMVGVEDGEETVVNGMITRCVGTSYISLFLQLKNMPTDGMFGSDVSSVEDDGTASVAMVRVPPDV